MSGPQQAPVASHRRTRLTVGPDVPNILVLVAGTVDPVNTKDGERANSYQGEPSDQGNWYWYDNKVLRAQLKDLERQHRNLSLFPFHGWTGDNNPANRRIAGRYLCDRLTGSDQEKSFYEAYKHREVHFHLMGHSHGGNVINEFTTQAALGGHWPRRWSIRSITYLSTPFFQRLHPLHVGRLHRECAILNVRNQFDLTQRVIADFSMMHLVGVQEKVPVEELKAQFGDAFRHFDGELYQRLKDGVKFEAGLHLDWGLVFEPSLVEPVYRQSHNLLRDMRDAMKKLREVVEDLARPMTFEVGEDLQGLSVEYERSVLSPQGHADLTHLLDFMIASFERIRRKAQARMDENRGRAYDDRRYGVFDFVDDFELRTTMVALVWLVRINPATLVGYEAVAVGVAGPKDVWRLFHDALAYQQAEFDNTVTTPAHQLQGTGHADRLVDLDITHHDGFSQHATEVAGFGKFIQALEAIEAKALHESVFQSQRLSRHDLMDLLFTLVAQLPVAKEAVVKLREGRRVVDGILDTVQGGFDHVPLPDSWLWQAERWALDLADTLRAIRGLLDDFITVLESRDVGPLELTGDSTKPFPMGSLPYLAVTAHSLSRMQLWPDVLRELRKHLGPRTSRRIQEQRARD